MPKGIYKRTKEYKDSIKGEKHPMFGKHHSEMSKKKSSLSHKGQTAWNKGKTGVYSKETLKRMSEVKKGKNTWSKGKKLSLKQRRKFSLLRRGEKNHNWKGGITPLREKIRGSFEYRQWRSDVYTRDNFTCQECGIKHRAIQAHHIKSFAFICDENNILSVKEALICAELWNINNGITLCITCHKKTDTYAKNYKLTI